MTDQPDTTIPSPESKAPNPLFDVMVGDDHLSDAIGHMRHKIRLLTLAVVGLVESPHDVQDTRCRAENHRDQNWAHDLESMAFDVAADFDKIVEAVDHATASGRA